MKRGRERAFWVGWALVWAGLLVGSPGWAADRFELLFQGKMRLIDLTYPLNPDNPYWPGPAYFPFRLDNIATLEREGAFSNTYCTPEHLGTHLDAPNHFVKGQIPLEQIPPTQFFGPAVVLNVSKKVKSNPDYQVSVADLKAWEQAHGPIPEGAILLAYTGWSQRWQDYGRYKNADDQGRLHFPGYAIEAAQFLVKERKIHGLGIDTLSVDYGPSRDFRVHEIAHGAGKYHLENVANLNQLPPKGAYLIVAPIKIQGGSGGQARIFALLP
ncbi:MAG: cyclase family protein [Candidatus Tectomicrobia bacterium]|uniref:Cyclase family protein n=1 Tax=Tectimicrobiota bacterium TaxID=2528274 RepID=A0A932CNN0_UNCTE|nr:cyclase family protein [Candidatus Tectomicrobia bacterium]